jgi:putative CocE/NonD family hydrolase
MRRSIAAIVLSALLCAVAAATAQAATPPKWTAYDRPATNGVVSESDVPITMSDGTVLRANVLRPDKPGRYPVLITQTPYNKSTPLGEANSYLVQRGYVHLIVDVRGTGSSQGTWDSFGPAEQRDGAEVVKWARAQPWSDGNIGLYGGSYMAITQMVTAAQQPPGLKAIFPIVPMADGYRDITFSGGQINVAFIPLWMGLVTLTGVIPAQYGLDGNPADLVQALTSLLAHVSGAVSFQTGTILNSAIGGDVAYDGDFWRTRSPLELADRIDVPTFVVGGLHDIFQRGEPLIYERLKNRVNTRLLVGPWTHTSTGGGLPRDGVPGLDQIALRWFDNYLKGIDTHVSAIPKVTQYDWGAEKYEVQPDWPDPSMKPARRYLRADSRLSTDKPPPSEAPDSFFQQPLSGICTQSTSQWTAGLTEQLPCTNDDRLNEPTTVNYTTAPLASDLHFAGPLLANLWVSTTAGDAVVSVRVTDVAPDGTSRELSSGWLAGSVRQVDAKRSRYVRGQLMQPWHPFTRDSVLPVPAGEPIELPVEIFPTNATIEKGHSLRVAVGPSDFPHAVPPLPQFANTLAGQVTILHDAQHPSYVALPTLGGCDPWAKPAKKRRGRKAPKVKTCKPLRVPQLVRGG